MKSLSLKQPAILLSMGVSLLASHALAHNHAADEGMAAGEKMMSCGGHGMMHGGPFGMIVMAGLALFLVLGILSFLKYLFKK